MDQEHDQPHKIHKYAKNLYKEGLRKLLQNDRSLVHRKLSGQTPLHIVINELTFANFEHVFEVIQVLVKYNANINSKGPKTPFSLVVDKLVGIEDVKAAQLLKFIIDSYYYIEVDGQTQELLANRFSDLFSRLDTDDKDKLGIANKSQVLSQILTHLTADGDGEKFIRVSANLAHDEQFKEVMEFLVKDGDLLRTAVDDPTENYKAILTLLTYLEDVFEVTGRLLCKVVHELEEQRPSATNNYYKCFDFLVDHQRIDVNAQNECKNTALHYAVRSKNEYAIRTLLAKGAHLGVANKFDVLPIRNIDPKVLEQHFDSCITRNGNLPGDEMFEITFDHLCFIPPEGSSQSELAPIQYMAKSQDLRHLVQHPLVTSFLFFKWIQLYLVFYTNLIFNTIFSVSLVSHIVYRSNTAITYLPFFLIFVCWVCLIVRVFFQLLIAPKHFFTSATNYLESTLIILTGYILYEIVSPDQSKTVFSRIGAITILLVTLDFLIMMGKLPFFTISNHMVMLRSVSVSFLRGLLLYSIILIGFALAFFMLIQTTVLNNITNKNSSSTNTTYDEMNGFASPGISIVKTFVMMIGELDAGNLQFNWDVWSCIIFVGFLILIPVVLMNLLVGLAVSDIQMIKSKANLYNWLERLKIVSVFEKVMLDLSPYLCRRNKICIFLKKLILEWTQILKRYPRSLLTFKPNVKKGQKIFRQVGVENLRDGALTWGDIYPLETSSRLFNFVLKHCVILDKHTISQAMLVLENKVKEQNETAEKEEDKAQIREMGIMLRKVLERLPLTDHMDDD